MSKMIQIRNVPDEVHRTLKARAAADGLSLSDYIKRDLVASAINGSIDDILARVRSRPRTEISNEEIVAILREVRVD